MGLPLAWYSLPIDLRNAIWRSYQPGQEVNGTPNTQYIVAARAAQDWIKANHPPTPTQQRLL